MTTTSRGTPRLTAELLREAGVGEFRKVDPVAATTELQVYAIVDGPLTIHPLSDARLPEQFRRPMLEHASPNRRLYCVATAKLEHDRLDALEVQQVREHQPSRPASDDPYLCTHHALLLRNSSGYYPTITEFRAPLPNVSATAQALLPPPAVL